MIIKMLLKSLCQLEFLWGKIKYILKCTIATTFCVRAGFASSQFVPVFFAYII